MKNCFVSLLLLAVLSAVAVAQNQQQITFKSGHERVQAVMYTPDGQGPFPAVIVVHEWYGLNDWVKQQAEWLAKEGYVTLAVDLYRGRVAKDSDEAHELMRGLPEDRAVRDMRAAFSYLQGQKNVRKERIGVIGWCMGGGFALELAINEPQLRAAVINYGRVATDPSNLKKINASVLGIFGGKDRGIPVESVQKFAAQLKDLGKKVDITVYPEAGHAFQNENNKNGYRAQDAEDARKRIRKFLRETLQ